ncbi:uncharacterized membrane protein YjjB (DUF3815 family) [Bacillus ectoiniformans]|uniref:threonine/serine exporter family protein n=1 Tax=Bacillus ectoiniformans TaxID=1494429 RepID=UPI001958FECC|nr:threonine/serine exporter family protein [Bacillus ectoiniformans]MBM7648234.1 uncharacterized membrane protein YjjB (DUF3815 family) [Bacillus ectoiniformans]
MVIAVHIVMSFIASVSFGIIFSVPKESLLKCGFVGMVGWMIYFLMTLNGVDAVPATVIAAFVIAVISQIYARAYRTPSIVFTVAGIIPLVPGGMAYNAMRHFVQNDYSTALNMAAKAFMISGSIAMGLVFSEVINELIKNKRSVKL